MGKLNCYGFLSFRLEKLRPTILKETDGSRFKNPDQMVD
jgi:hypothetical protein